MAAQDTHTRPPPTVRVNAQEVGFVPGPKPAKKAKFVYLLGADNQELTDSIPSDAFVVYQGSHGDVGAMRANGE